MDINLIGAVCPTGYGITNINLVDSLIRNGVRLSLFPVNGKNKLEFHSRFQSSIDQALKNAESFDINSPCVKIWHQYEMAMMVGRGAHIGFPIFELNKFNDEEKHSLRSCDKIFVCSKWAKKVVEEETGHTDVHVVPLGVDSNIFQPTLSNYKTTVFLNVGKWEIRKGHDLIAQAFNKAFKPEDDVMLWMMCQNHFYQPQWCQYWENFYKGSDMGHKTSLIPWQSSDVEVSKIMRQADCGVFPARAEGWNLELLEMMSCGKMVLATDYAGHTEFCNKENTHLLDVKELMSAHDATPAYPDLWFTGQGNWAKLGHETIDSMAEYMRHVHELKQSGNLKLNQKGIETAQKYSWKNSCNELLKNL